VKRVVHDSKPTPFAPVPHEFAANLAASAGIACAETKTAEAPKLAETKTAEAPKLDEQSALAVAVARGLGVGTKPAPER
jgi:hypothetical protein